MQYRILGPLQVVDAGRPLDPGAPKQRALLAYLLINANRLVQSDKILEDLWPQGPPGGGAKTLQVHVSKLRRALSAGLSGNGPVTFEGSGYVLEVGPDDLDSLRFERMWRRARADLATSPRRAEAGLRRALGLWRGPALADFAYESFAQEEIRRLDELHLTSIEDHCDASLALGREAEILDQLEMLVDRHPLRERVRGQLMLALYRLGRQSEALQVFSDLRRTLGEELGIEPTSELRDLEDRILLHDTGLLPPPPPEVTADRLPVRLTNLVGRWRQQADLHRLLTEHRLITVTGVGGVGKTSLAVEVARSAGAEFPDGVWMVPLASLADGDLVTDEVASALGLTGTNRAKMLVDHLQDRRALLVLDNCEHLLDAVARLIGDLLQRCTELSILATSRSELSIGGEAVFALQPLEVPGPDAGSDQIHGLPAVQLILERVRLKQPGFSLDAETTEPIATICRKVAGIPLALELAAARLQSMSARELAARLDAQMELLTGGSRTGDPRQRTLEATMDWSYGLLTHREQAVLRRVSVFRSGFTMEAAELVADGRVGESGGVPSVLGHLVRASLLKVDTGGPKAVYSMLEPVRQYGLKLLAAAGEFEETRRRFVDFCSTQSSELRGLFETGRWTRLMESGKAIVDDARSALDWSIRAGDSSVALRLAATLAPYWSVAGATSEGFSSLSVTLAAAPREPSNERIWALDQCARFAIGLGVPADPWLDELDEWASTVGTADVLSRALGTRGLLAFARGDLMTALHLLRDAYERDRLSESGPARGVLLVDCLIRLGRLDDAEQILVELDRKESRQEEYGNHWITVSWGMLAFCRGNLVEAEQHLERAVKAFGLQQSPSGQMESMMYLGWISLDLGKERRARMLAERSLAMARKETDVLYEASNLWLLARVALQAGDLAGARAALSACTDVARRRRESVNLALALFVWADLAAAGGDQERAARLFGAAEHSLAAIPHILPPTIGAGYEKTAAALHGSLGEDGYAQLHAAGTRMSLTAAVEFALA